jgi:hypothetical protein
MWPPQTFQGIREDMRRRYCATLAEYLPTVSAAPCRPDYRFTP